MPDTSPVVKGFYDPDTATVTYVVRDPGSDACAIVDPVLDFEPKAARCATRSAERVLQYLRSEGLRACWILETHVHADHLSGAAFLREALGAPAAARRPTRCGCTTRGRCTGWTT